MYSKDINYFAEQTSLQQLDAYLRTTSYVDQADPITNWHAHFLSFAQLEEATPGDLVNPATGASPGTQTHHASPGVL